jgi:hypothetical protein
MPAESDAGRTLLHRALGHMTIGNGSGRMKTMMVVAMAMMVLGCAQAAMAQDGERGGLRGACKADFQQYCADVAQGGGARLKCLKDNQDKLSADCKSALAAMSSAREACAQDAAKYCADSQRGADRLKCMTANKDKLSDGCKAALTGMSAE